MHSVKKHLVSVTMKALSSPLLQKTRTRKKWSLFAMVIGLSTVGFTAWKMTNAEIKQGIKVGAKSPKTFDMKL